MIGSKQSADGYEIDTEIVDFWRAGTSGHGQANLSTNPPGNPSH
jgi:hypothetical protein